jgi:hypothetical protein
VHTPLFCGQFSSAGAFFFANILTRPFLTNWFIVGTKFS